MNEQIAFFLHNLYCKSQSAIAINLNSRAEGGGGGGGVSDPH